MINNIMKEKWIICLFFVFILSGCSATLQDTYQKNIEMVVSNVFKQLDKTEYEEYQNWTQGSAGQVYVHNTMPRWIEDRFEPYMTPKAYQNLLQTSLYSLPVFAYKAGLKMKLTVVQIDKKNGYYDFKGTLLINKDAVGIEGSAQIDKKGKISFININNLSDIAERIHA